MRLVVLQLPGGGVSLTLAELQDMAVRQQQQLEVQHQLLSAREQRLHFLKHGQAGGQADSERLRRLRERVEAQEQKLRKLRALRGQVDSNKLSNAALSEYTTAPFLHSWFLVCVDAGSGVSVLCLGNFARDRLFVLYNMEVFTRFH